MVSGLASGDRKNLIMFRFFVGITIIVLFLSVLGVDANAAESPFFVTYNEDNESVKLEPLTDSPADVAQFEPASLPLVLTEPAVLKLGDSGYALSKEGLYRVWDAATSTVVRQCILYQGDVWRLAGHLSRLTVYANRHKSDTPAQWNSRARSGQPVSLLCGNTSQFVLDHMNSLNVKARRVQSVAKSNWNHFADGHCLTEIYDPELNRWILFDPSMGIRLRHQGRLLSLQEATELYRAGKRPDYIEFVNKESEVDPSFNYLAWISEYIKNPAAAARRAQAYIAMCQKNEEAIHSEYDHLIEIPFIDKCFVADSDTEEQLFKTLWPQHTRLSASEFRRRFYGSPAQ